MSKKVSSMHANALAAEKMIALKLHGMTWLDKQWMLKKLSPQMRQKVKSELAQLKAMGVQNPQELLSQLSDGDKGTAQLPQKSSQKTQSQQIDTLGLSATVAQQLKAPMPEQLRQAVAQYLGDKG
jgi:hypothetical protein